MPFCTLAADHTGITVSNLDRALAFWRDLSGFEFSDRGHPNGGKGKQINGIKGAELKPGVVKAPCGHQDQLLEYLAPPERKHHADRRPCDVGSVHIALIVDNLDAILK